MINRLIPKELSKSTKVTSFKDQAYISNIGEVISLSENLIELTNVILKGKDIKIISLDKCHIYLKGTIYNIEYKYDI